MSLENTPTTDNNVAGHAESLKNRTLETGASLSQSFAPVSRLCAHLNAYHTPAAAPGSVAVEANHYCAHLNEDVRQCILYDSDAADARLIGVEYMIKPHLYESLDAQERRLWHSHVFEVKSGMLVMPTPGAAKAAGIAGEKAWEVAENAEMEEVVVLYGKVYHLWQTERGDTLPLGEPRLMTSFTHESQFPDFEGTVGERDGRFGVDFRVKAEGRRGIEVPEIHPDADSAWKEQGTGSRNAV
ncbi:hypothetical protein MBLNU230_g4549t1 [Neophaeotheca triangularis]